MDAQRFSTTKEYLDHLTATRGDKFHDVVLIASQLKNFGMTVRTMRAPDPVKTAITHAAGGVVITNAVAILVTLAGLQAQADDVMAAADNLIVLAGHEADARLAAEKPAPDQPIH